MNAEQIKPFLRIDNRFFVNEKINTFTKIGTEGFTIYSYLLYKQGMNSSTEVSIKMIQTFLNQKPKRTKLKRPKDGLKDKRTIYKYLEALKRENLIIIHSDFSKKIRLNDILVITCNCNPSKGFESISCDLFLDEVRNIGHIGWSIYCLLAKMHNENFGDKYNIGFANPSEETIGRIIGRHITTVKKYLAILENRNLIDIEVQKPIYKGIDKNGNDLFEFASNHYIVHSKYKDNKYHVSFKSNSDNEKFEHAG